MKAFVSYSINDKDELVIALLSSKLREKNFSISMSYNTILSNPLNYMTQRMINESNLFIGVITKNSHEVLRVENEWKFARQSGIPNILLLEENMQVNSELLKYNYVVFNRKKPHAAIDEIKRRMLPKNATEDFLPWVLGGAALVAVIGLLSSPSKR